jgi:hypothetical protein
MSTLKVDNISPQSSWIVDEIAGNTIKQSDAGKVIQVVTANYKNGGTHAQVSTSSTSYTHSSLSATITPTNSDSTIHITVVMWIYYPVDNGTTWTRVTSGGSTESYSVIWQEGGTLQIESQQDHYATGFVGGQVVMQGVVPHDGGLQTYRVEGKAQSSSYSMVFPAGPGSGGSNLITLMEIAG